MRLLGGLLVAVAFLITATLSSLLSGFERMGSTGPRESTGLWAFGGPLIVLGIFLATTGGMASGWTKRGFILAALACLCLALPWIGKGEPVFLLSLGFVAVVAIAPMALARPPTDQPPAPPLGPVKGPDDPRIR